MKVLSILGLFPSDRIPAFRRWDGTIAAPRLFSLGLLLMCLGTGGVLELGAVPIAGANGAVVDFAGIKSAGPAGLKVQIKAGDAAIDVPWEKIDLARLQAEQPTIYEAYQLALRGQSRELNLGSYAPKEAPMKREVKNFQNGAERHGWFETSAGGGKFAIQLPSGEPRGVLFISMGQDGRSLRYIGGVGASRWADFAEKFQFAVMSYHYPVPDGIVGPHTAKGAEFIHEHEKSAQAVVTALESFAKQSGKVKLATAPIAIYGTDALGAAFAFNLSQTIPERVVAAVASKGAFYSAKLTEESASVPLLLIWGEFDSDIDLFEPTHKHDEVYYPALEMKPSWIYAMEPRGASGESPFSQKLATTFIDRMILARMGTEGELKELDRTRAWIGDLDTFEISRMEDPEVTLSENQTWLPDGEIAKLWEQFLNGTMELDAPN